MGKFKWKIAEADTNDLAMYERMAAFIKGAGFDAMGCGAPAELTQDQMADPKDSWVRFTAMAGGITKLVETELINGVLSKAHIEKNAALIAEKSRILARHGLRGSLRALEPQWLPESYYEKHPEIRGPRVDHPGVARRRYYSPCLDRREVLAHYREAVRKLLELAPALGVINIWSNDSGGGICWSAGLYSGKNGPEQCRKVGMGTRIRKWLRAMLAGAKDAGGKLEITFGTHGLGRNDTYEVLSNLPAHTRLTAGFGPFPNEPFIYPESKALLAASKEAKRPAILGVDPTLGYPMGPIVEPPVEYFIFDIFSEAAKSGAGMLATGGIKLGKDGEPTAATRAVVAALTRPPKGVADVEKAAAKLAKELVGGRLSGALLSAWRDVDTAFRIWPNNGDQNHVLYPFYSVLGDRWLVRPLVAAPERLTDEEKSYFSRYRHGSRDEAFENSFFISESVKNYEEVEYRWPIADYETMMLHMNRAVDTLEEALSGAGDDEGEGRLRQEYYRVAMLQAVWRTQKNVFRCGSIIDYFTGENREKYEKGAPTYRRWFLESADDEAANCREMIRLMRESAEPLIATGDEESSFSFPHNLSELLEKKIALMEAHRGDIDVLFPNCPEEEFVPATYEDTDEKLDAEGK